jgi:hypothetical protein
MNARLLVVEWHNEAQMLNFFKGWRGENELIDAALMIIEMLSLLASTVEARRHGGARVD